MLGLWSTILSNRILPTKKAVLLKEWAGLEIHTLVIDISSCVYLYEFIIYLCRLRNCAFVDFTNEALALQAQRQLNGYIQHPDNFQLNFHMI